MNEKQKIHLIKIVISLALVISGAITDFVPLFFAAFILCGYPVLIQGIKGVLKGKALDENFLMTIACIGAILCHEYSEAAGVMVFYSVGQFFENYAVNRSRKSIADAMDIKVLLANKIVDGQIVPTPQEDLVEGDIVLVKPGEKIPVDGIIIEGSSTLDTKALTGESLPIDVKEDCQVISGCVNGSGILKIQATSDFEDSAVGKILELIEDAAISKSKVEKFITKFARYYTPMVVVAAILLAIVPPLFIPEAKFMDWIYRAMIFLVISCPCALVISVPMTLFAGIGAASSKGILVKGSSYLEAISQVKTFAFDKTGTLTKGNFKVVSVHPMADIKEDELLSAAYYGESLSNHPIAKAVSEYALISLKDFQKEFHYESYNEISGHGAVVELESTKYFCGNSKLMESIDINYQEPTEVGSVVHVGKEENGAHAYLGYVVVADVLREETKETISKLSSRGIDTVMLTGDKKEVAQAIGNSIGLTDVYSELLPQDKVSLVKDIITKNKASKGSDHLLAFVGDGINDAPVLALSDIGIAMGAFGSDAAIEAADVVIMADDLGKVNTLIKIAKKVMTIAKENVFFALVIKFGVMILGALGLASMWAAVFADVGVAVLAILNAMRVLKVKE